MFYTKWKLTTWTIHDMYTKGIKLTQMERKLASIAKDFSQF